MPVRVLTVADVDANEVAALLGRFGLELELLEDDAKIAASFWGEPEAGVEGCRVVVRDDTPLHSVLHEACHVICMDGRRRDDLYRDAGGDDLEEAAVCYLQVVLGGVLDGVGRRRLMRDMDRWGYSFRLGSTRRWFDEDAADARAWLVERGLLSAAGAPCYRLRV